jgi:hypothetical protein
MKKGKEEKSALINDSDGGETTISSLNHRLGTSDIRGN